MRLRTIISTFLAAAILPTDGQLVVQQRLRSLPEVGKDDPPMTMMELVKEASSMSMMEFVDLSPTDLEPIFRDSSVAMVLSGPDNSVSEGDYGSKSGKGDKSSGEGACTCSSGKSGKVGGSKSGKTGGNSTACPSLQDLFGRSSKSSKSGHVLLEVNANSEDIAPDGGVADFNTTADMDLWYQNPLSNDDGFIGNSSGFCTLLPAAKNFQCAMTWTLNTGDIFYLTGLSPNSNKPGVIAITGGTGCENATGSVQMTGMGEDFDTYEYELLEPPSEAEAATCTLLEDRFGDGLTEDNTNSEGVAANGAEAYLNKTADQRLWSKNYLRSAANIIGKSSGFCTLLLHTPFTQLPGSDVFQCAMTWTFLDTEDSIYLTGLSANSIFPGVIAITGGTGCYENAAGSVMMTGVGATVDFTSYEYKLLPPSAETCMPLEDRFAAPGLLEVNDYSEGVAADGGVAYFNKTADMDLWKFNLLFPNEGGPRVGQSSGVCTLLPDIAVFQCSTTLNFDDTEGSVTLAGLSPNSNETGILVVTGGTGCYEGATGAVEFTAQGQGNDFNEYLYVWKNTTEEDDTCDC